MNKSNVEVLKKARSMCLLYGIVCFMAGVISFAVMEEQGLGAVLMVIALAGFWRLSHKIKFVLLSEEPKFFKDVERDKDTHGRRE